MLAIAVAGTFGWIIYGWDGTVNQVFGTPYGIGIHWSTVQTFALFFYLLTLNLHVGGLRSFNQFMHELKKDVLNLRKIASKNLADEYASETVIGPSRAACFALGFCCVALFGFEIVWVPLYDYFQFGSWYWPVYAAADPSGIPFLSEMFLRNVGVTVVMLVAAVGAVCFVWDWEGEKLKRRYSITWRFDRWFLVILTLTIAFWLSWIYYPHSAVQISFNQVVSQGPFNSTFFDSQRWIFPTQGFFPQNEYTFYQATLFLKPYATTAIYGFHVVDDWLHLDNVITKYLSFLLVSYPALIVAKRNEVREETRKPGQVVA